jgi:phosphoglycerate dehydrogenase-like enzyme
MIIQTEIWKSATILATVAALPPSADLAPKLKFIHFFSAGTDHISKHPIYTHSSIPLTTSSGIHGPMIAEWVILQILTHGHKQKKLLEWQKEKRWGSHAELGALKDNVGSRLGVLGYGSIGRQTARIGKSMGLDVIAYTASPRPTPESKRDEGYIVPGTGDEDGSIPSAWYSGIDKKSLHNFLSQDIDILLVSVPLTKETRHFLGEEEFEILGRKKNALIVNISRGAILEQNALIKFLKKSLEEGGLRGAALDVTDPEPLGEDSELWGLDNVTITPHISGLSTDYEDRSYQILDINIKNLEAGRPFINEVDRERGY